MVAGGVGRSIDANINTNVENTDMKDDTSSNIKLMDPKAIRRCMPKLKLN